MLDTLLDDLSGRRERVIALQERLVSLPALGPENGGHGEAAKAEYLVDELERIGFEDIQQLKADDDRVQTAFRPNICALLPGKDTKRTLWIISHTDVVPAGDLDLWQSDPFTLKVDGDMLYGRGVEDNHHGLVASLLAAEALLESDTRPAVNLGLLLVADEETGNRYGLEHVFKEHGNLFSPDDLFVVPDFGSPDSSMVEVSEKGLLWLKLTVSGRQCHASTPEKGTNSLLAASDLILRLRNLHRYFDRRDDLFNPPVSTFEATKKEANVPNINTIPGRDVFYLDCRVLPGYGLDAVIDRVKALAAETETSLGVHIECEVVHRESAPPTDPESEVVRALIRAINRVADITATPMGVGGGTVAALIRRRGFPAAVWCTSRNTAHQPNEHTRIGDIIRDAQVFTALLLDETLRSAQ